MRLFKFFIAGIFLTVSFSCKKDPATASFDPRFYFVYGGTGNLDKTLVLFSSSDSVTYNVIISSTYYLSSKVVVKVAAADSYRDTYNSNNGTSFQAMPLGSYSFKDTLTCNTSSVYDTIAVTISRHAFTTGQEYMLPLQIISADGNEIDPDLSIIYLHTRITELQVNIYNC